MLRYDKTNPHLVSVETLLGAVEAAQSLQADVTALLAEHGLAPDRLRAGGGYVPLHCVVDFLNRAAEVLRCESFGLLVAEYQPAAPYPVLGKMVRFAPTLQEAVVDSIRFAAIHSQYSDWRLEHHGDQALLCRGTRVSYQAPVVQIQTLAVASTYKALSAVLGQRFPASRILFSYRRPERLAPFQHFFALEPAFEQGATGIVFPARLLRSRLPAHDPDVYRLFRTHLAALEDDHDWAEDLVSRVRGQIKQALGSRHCNLAGVATRLGVHSRTLQRSLGRYDSSFQELLKGVRQEVAAEYLLNSSLAVSELAELLGYANASAFSRAFKQYTGLAPKTWRETKK